MQVTETQSMLNYSRWCRSPSFELAQGYRGGEHTRHKKARSPATEMTYQLILFYDVSHQEDFYAFTSLSLDPEELRLSLKKHLGIDWDPKSVVDSAARQVVFVGIYDG